MAENKVSYALIAGGKSPPPAPTPAVQDRRVPLPLPVFDIKRTVRLSEAAQYRSMTKSDSGARGVAAFTSAPHCPAACALLPRFSGPLSSRMGFLPRSTSFT